MIRLLVVDDHPAIADGLVARYGARPGFAVAGATGRLDTALQRASQGGIDVAIVDVHLGARLTPPQVSALARFARVVLYTAHASDPSVRALLDAGASAAVDKASPLDALDAALHAAHDGHPAPETPAATPGVRALLSEREYEVYRALARCQTPKEVAASLGIAKSTTYCHIDNVRRKLGLRTLQEIVAHALTSGA